MSVRERVIASRLLEMIEADKEYADAIGLSGSMERTGKKGGTNKTADKADKEFARKDQTKPMSMSRKTRRTRSDCRVGSFEKKRGIPAGSIRHSNGRDVRSDMKLGTLRKQVAKGIF